MKLDPKYTITNKLLENIKRISSLVIELNNRRFPDIVLVDFEKEARARSSHSSTSVEGNPLPLTEVKRLIKSSPENLRNTEKEVLNYNKTLVKLNTQVRKGDCTFGKDLIISTHRQVMEGLLPSYRLGKYRKIPVVVNNPSTGEVIYLPPDTDEVEGLMKELTDFVASHINVLDPLILAGLFHKQFVIIHPFTDGNGRTCRLITKVLLTKLGLDTFNLFSFENYYNKNVTKYFKNVGLSGNYYDIAHMIDFTEWLEYFTDGVIDEILRVKGELDKTMFLPDYSLSSHQQLIINYLKKKHYITDYDYSLITDRAKATRVIDFNGLIKLGIIERKGIGRKTYYVKK